ncbi:glycosyltransferase [Flavihumibacter sp. R14]|nr:glycosyltransferase [Flavihumibacter soli]
MLAETPTVSIVIPSYNRSELLLEAIASVVGQTYPHWELIIVDDGSTDGTADAVARLSDQRIKVIRQPHTGHIGIIRNEGIRQSTGSWVAFLDSDDIWVPEKLDLQLAELEKGKQRWIYGGFELMDEKRNSIPFKWGLFRPLSGDIAEAVICMDTGVSISSVLIQRELLEEVGMFNVDPTLLYRGDLELIMRIAVAADAAVVPCTVVKIREHRGRITSSLNNPDERTALAYEIFMKSEPPERYRRQALRKQAFYLSEASVRFMRSGQFRQAAKNLRRALLGGDDLRHWLSAVKRGLLRPVSRTAIPNNTSQEILKGNKS